MLERYGEWVSSHAGRVGFVFRSLQSRNYRWYFFGNMVSLVGTWMQRMAISWLVYKLTGSAILLGTVDFASQFSAFLLMPFAGVLIDGGDIRRLLIITQALGAAQALVLGGLTATGHIGFGHLVIMSIFLGMINAFDMPARQAFTVHLVEKKEDLMNAIALNSSVFNMARLVGPAVAGMVVSWVGEAMCFLANAISFLPIIIILMRLSVIAVARTGQQPQLLDGLQEGIEYSARHPVIGPVLLLLSLASFIGMSYVVLLPVFAKEVLGGGPQTLGWLMGANGLGALIAALMLASQKSLEGLEKRIPLAFGLFGIGVAVFCRMRQVPLAMAMLVFNGFWMITGWASSNTLLQTEVEEGKRARVMSLYVMSFMGMAPLGSLAQGYVSQRLGIEATLTISGLLCCLGSALYFIHRFSRVESHPR